MRPLLMREQQFRSLPALVAQRQRERLEGGSSLSPSLLAALDATDWLDVMHSQAVVAASLAGDLRVARELEGAYDVRTVLLQALGPAALRGAILVDAGCQHGRTSLLAWHMLPCDARPARVLWVDRDASCRAASLASQAAHMVSFVCAALEDLQAWEPEQRYVLLCVRVCGALEVVRALPLGPQCVGAVVWPCCQEEAECGSSEPVVVAAVGAP